MMIRAPVVGPNSRYRSRRFPVLSASPLHLYYAFSDAARFPSGAAGFRNPHPDHTKRRAPFLRRPRHPPRRNRGPGVTPIFPGWLDRDFTAELRAHVDAGRRTGRGKRRERPRNDLRHPIPGGIMGRLAANPATIELGRLLLGGEPELRMREQVLIRSDPEPAAVRAGARLPYRRRFLPRRVRGGAEAGLLPDAALPEHGEAGRRPGSTSSPGLTSSPAPPCSAATPGRDNPPPRFQHLPRRPPRRRRRDLRRRGGPHRLQPRSAFTRRRRTARTGLDTCTSPPFTTPRRRG